MLDDIALDDPKPVQKKRGMFSRIMDSESHSERPGQKDGVAKSSWHHFGGRKRGQSGQGAELGDIPGREATPRPVEKEVQKPVTPQASAQSQSIAQTPTAQGQSPAQTQSPTQAQTPAQAQSSATVQSQAVPGAQQEASHPPTVTVNGPSILG